MKKSLFILLLISLSTFILAQNVNSIKIGKLEIALNDFDSQMNPEEAEQACAKLGEGWRIPNNKELQLMFQNKKKIGGFKDEEYWSSTIPKGNDITGGGTGFLFNFKNGQLNELGSGFYPGDEYHYVRPVRSVK